MVNNSIASRTSSLGEPKGMSSLSPMIIKLDTSRAAQLMFGRYTASAAFKFQTLLRNIRLHFQHEGEGGRRRGGGGNVNVGNWAPLHCGCKFGKCYTTAPQSVDDACILCIQFFYMLKISCCRCDTIFRDLALNSKYKVLPMKQLEA